MSSSSSHFHRSIPTEDRLSSFPDSIISHILSFLPTKDSVATSVLSKRWNPLWLSVLDLNFDAQTFEDYVTFRHAIYSVIVSRDITLPIRSFRLKFGIEYDINDINRFIKAAIQRGIEELDIDMSENINGLTDSIFSCKTLTVLKLKNLSVKDDNCQIDLPLLKVLYLDPFKTDHIRFLLGCPNLEELQTTIAAFYLKKLNPETPNLAITSIPESQYTLKYFLPRVEIMRLKLISHKYLKVANYDSLIQMELFFFNSNGKSWGEKWKWMLEVLQHSPKLQHFTIHEDIENGIYEDNWQDPEIVPECLSSQLITCLFTGCRGRKCELQFIEYVMQNSKVLRSMTIRSASSITLNEKKCYGNYLCAQGDVNLYLIDED